MTLKILFLNGLTYKPVYEMEIFLKWMSVTCDILPVSKNDITCMKYIFMSPKKNSAYKA